MRYFHLPLLSISLLLAGCAVGPDFHSPAAPNTQRYTELPLPDKTVNVPAARAGGKAQRFVIGQAIPAEWWALYRSPALDELIKRGIANNPTLTAAKATLTQAQESLSAQIGSSYYPSVTGSLAAQRVKNSTAAFAAGNGNMTNFNTGTFSVYNASVNVSYTLDAFGGERRQVEALRAQVDYQYYELQAAYITLTSNIVITAINIAALHSQIDATNELIKAQTEELTLINKQFQLGSVSEANVLAQQTLLAQTRANLPTLQKKLAQARNALAVLVGALPSNAQLPDFTLASLSIPQQIPVSVPSALAKQRPDIQAAEALLHAASAQVGVATANLYPKLTLSGSYGSQALAPSNLFNAAANAWNIGGQLAQPLFNGGALRAQRRAAIAAYQAAGAQYQQTVLQAFQNVADTLNALETDARALQQQAAAENAARASLTLVRNQFRLGGASYLDLLNAQQQYQQTKIAFVQAQATRYADTAALFQALGGGWWNRTTQ